MIEVVNISSLEALGLAVNMSFNTRYGQRTVEDTVKLLSPSINTGQYFAFADGGFPVGFINWAHMSQTSVDKYLQWNGYIGTDDWTSGEQVWVMAVYVLNTYHLPCLKLTRNRLLELVEENGWQKTIHWVRDKPGTGVERREIRYA